MIRKGMKMSFKSLVLEVLIETSHFFKKDFPIKTEIGSLPSENTSRSRTTLSIVKILLWS